jgi:hypothetical protein
LTPLNRAEMLADRHVRKLSILLEKLNIISDRYLLSEPLFDYYAIHLRAGNRLETLNNKGVV